jgi:hypothetical protein
MQENKEKNNPNNYRAIVLCGKIIRIFFLWITFDKY